MQVSEEKFLNFFKSQAVKLAASLFIIIYLTTPSANLAEDGGGQFNEFGHVEPYSYI